MANTTPPIYTAVHQEEILIEDNDLQSLNEETYRKIGQNNNWLIDLRPIGSIIFTNDNQPGGGTPDPRIWKECDGSEIVNPESPLRSIGVNQNTVPNFKKRFLRFSSDSTTNPVGGTNEHNLSHNHSTGGPSSSGGGIEKDDDDDRRRRVSHGHAIATQYSNPTTIDSPDAFYCNAYMKVV